MHTVLHADDTPHQIAFGAAVATWVAFLPIVGLQTVVAVFLAAIARANKAICVPFVWITNPATMIPIYTLCYMLGRVLVPNPASPDEIDLRAHLETPLSQYHGWGRFVDPEFWHDLFRLLLSLGTELWIGCMVAGIFFGVVAYFMTRWGVVAFRERHRLRRLRRSVLREQLRGARVEHGPDEIEDTEPAE